MINDREISLGERNDIIQTVYENKNSKYWKIIRNHLIGILQIEDKYLDTFKYSGMNDKNSQEYNDTLKRISLIKRMININEEIINRNTTILEKLKQKINFDKLYDEVKNTGRSFVGLFTDLSANGETKK